MSDRDRMPCLMCDTPINENQEGKWEHADGSIWCPGKSAAIATPSRCPEWVRFAGRKIYCQLDTDHEGDCR